MIQHIGLLKKQKDVMWFWEWYWFIYHRCINNIINELDYKYINIINLKYNKIKILYNILFNKKIIFILIIIWFIVFIIKK